MLLNLNIPPIYDLTDAELEAMSDWDRPDGSYAECYIRLFKCALTNETTLDDVFVGAVDGFTLLEMVHNYRQLPDEQYKSAEDLLAWAKENGIQPPPINHLNKALSALDEFDLPFHERPIWNLLVSYFEFLDLFCFIKLPAHRRTSMRAMDYYIDSHLVPKNYNQVEEGSYDSDSEDALDPWAAVRARDAAIGLYPSISSSNVDQ